MICSVCMSNCEYTFEYTKYLIEKNSEELVDTGNICAKCIEQYKSTFQYTTIEAKELL